MWRYFRMRRDINPGLEKSDRLRERVESAGRRCKTPQCPKSPLRRHERAGRLEERPQQAAFGKSIGQFLPLGSPRAGQHENIGLMQKGHFTDDHLDIRLLFRFPALLDFSTERARMLAVKRPLQRIAQGRTFRVMKDHRCPGNGLQYRPMSANGGNHREHEHPSPDSCANLAHRGNQITATFTRRAITNSPAG